MHTRARAYLHAYRDVCGKVRRQFVADGPLLPPCGSQGLNLGHQSELVAKSFPAEPSHWPFSFNFGGLITEVLSFPELP